MPVPTDEQLKAFANQLPQIYRDILAAFPGINPHRKQGYGVFVESLFDWLDEHTAGYDVSEVKDAVEKLQDTGFALRSAKQATVTPSELGERLLAVVTGHRPQPAGAPPLPQLTWA